MNLKNYTSTVQADRSVSLIEHELVCAGAQHISKWYDPEAKTLEGIMFQMSANERNLVFRLPSRWRVCYDLM